MRVFERLEQLYRIGDGEGANRPGLSAEEQRAHELVAGWMEQAGLRVERDPVGNLYGRLDGEDAALTEVWTGSHLDTVPNGGRFDGALGVVAGLEAVERAGRSRRTLTVVAFRDEEGWRFGRGCFGSRALCGALAPGEAGARDAGGVRVADAVAALVGPGAIAEQGWLERPPAAFLELHVEQGPVLARTDVPLGVVTRIVGLARAEVEIVGTAAHAGTTPMGERDDALCKAAELVLRIRDTAAALPGAVATVGVLEVEPGAANVIPGRVRLTVDARAPDAATLDRLAASVPAVPLRRAQPVELAPELRTLLRQVVEGRGLPVVELHSGAGHDAGVLAAAGVPSAMLFVRSLAGGASHSPAEESSSEDVALCIDVLAEALRRLASG
jgi:hydantoinase/carbamoylase family amidase